MSRTGILIFTLLAWLGTGVAGFAAPLRVAATTGMVGDLVRQVGGSEISLEVLMGPGVDPHLYKATASDVVTLRRADVIFYNGLLLEGKMTEVFERMAKQKERVHAITEELPRDRLLGSQDYAGHPDPHVWFDVDLWSQCLPLIQRRLTEARPEKAAVFAANAAAARERLAALHAWAQETARSLPAAQRVLVTSHDAYNYFGRAYGFEVIGLQGISTVTEAALSDMARLTDLIRERGIKAIFVESSVSHGTIERISADTGVKIGGELFSDAMGTPGEMENGYDLGTYEGMIRHNLTTIRNGLR